MAKQAGEFFIEGTIDDLTFYKMDGKYYLRMKSSLTGKKFWRNQAFERSRESCKRFAEGNKLASKLYRMIDKDKRVYKLFCFLKKRAILLLKEGKSLTETEEVLMDYLKNFRFISKDSPEDVITTGCCSVEQQTILSNRGNTITLNIVSKKSNTGTMKMTERYYACAVGPPKVIGI